MSGQVFHGHCRRQEYDCKSDWTSEQTALRLHTEFPALHTNHGFAYDTTPVTRDVSIENIRIGPSRYSLLQVRLMYKDNLLNHSHLAVGKKPVIAGTMVFSQ